MVSKLFGDFGFDDVKDKVGGIISGVLQTLDKPRGATIAGLQLKNPVEGFKNPDEYRGSDTFHINRIENDALRNTLGTAVDVAADPLNILYAVPGANAIKGAGMFSKLARATSSRELTFGRRVAEQYGIGAGMMGASKLTEYGLENTNLPSPLKTGLGLGVGLAGGMVGGRLTRSRASSAGSAARMTEEQLSQEATPHIVDYINDLGKNDGWHVKDAQGNELLNAKTWDEAREWAIKNIPGRENGRAVLINNKGGSYPAFSGNVYPGDVLAKNMLRDWQIRDPESGWHLGTRPELGLDYTIVQVRGLESAISNYSMPEIDVMIRSEGKDYKLRKVQVIPSSRAPIDAGLDALHPKYTMPFKSFQKTNVDADEVLRDWILNNEGRSLREAFVSGSDFEFNNIAAPIDSMGEGMRQELHRLSDTGESPFVQNGMVYLYRGEKNIAGTDFSVSSWTSDPEKAMAFGRNLHTEHPVFGIKESETYILGAWHPIDNVITPAGSTSQSFAFEHEYLVMDRTQIPDSIYEKLRGVPKDTPPGTKLYQVYDVDSQQTVKFFDDPREAAGFLADGVTKSQEQVGWLVVYPDTGRISDGTSASGFKEVKVLDAHIPKFWGVDNTPVKSYPLYSLDYLKDGSTLQFDISQIPVSKFITTPEVRQLDLEIRPITRGYKPSIAPLKTTREVHGVWDDLRGEFVPGYEDVPLKEAKNFIGDSPSDNFRYKLKTRSFPTEGNLQSTNINTGTLGEPLKYLEVKREAGGKYTVKVPTTGEILESYELSSIENILRDEGFSTQHNQFAKAKAPEQYTDMFKSDAPIMGFAGDSPSSSYLKYEPPTPTTVELTPVIKPENSPGAKLAREIAGETLPNTDTATLPHNTNITETTGGAGGPPKPPKPPTSILPPDMPPPDPASSNNLGSIVDNAIADTGYDSMIATIDGIDKNRVEEITNILMDKFGISQPDADIVALFTENMQKANKGDPSKIAWANNLLRGMWATGDGSWFGIQGLLTLPRMIATGNPRDAFDTFMLSTAIMVGDKKALGKYLVRVAETVPKGAPKLTEIATGKGLHLSFLKGPASDFNFSLVDKMTKGVINPEAAFEAAGDISRISSFYNEWARFGTEANIAKYGREGVIEQIATAINRATGVGSKPLGGHIGSFALFAPRFFQSQIEVITKAITDGTIEGALARRHLLTLIGTGATLTIAANYLRGYETELNPTDSNFMRIRNIQGNDISVFGPWDSLVKLVIHMGQGDFKYVRTKFGPLASIAANTLTGETFLGERFNIDNPGTMAKSLLLPFAWQNIGRESFAGSSLGFFGVKSSPLTASEILDLNMKNLGLDPQDPLQRREYLAENPEQRPLFGESAKAVEAVRQDISGRSRLNDELTSSNQQPLVNFRDNRTILQREQRNKLDVLMSNSEFTANTEKRKWVQSYYDLFDNARDPISHDINGPTLDILQANWVAQNGIEAWNYLQEYMLIGKNPVELRYLLDMRKLTELGYFDIPKYRDNIYVLSDGLTDDQIEQYRTRVSAARYTNPRLASMNFKDAMRQVLRGELTGRQIMALDLAGKDVSVNPQVRDIKRDHPQLFAWFNPVAHYSDLEILQARGIDQQIPTMAAVGGG